MKILLNLLFLAFILSSCGGNSTDNGQADEVKTITPVTVTSVENIPLKEEIVLNATSTYLLKISVKAPINGYIQSSSIKIGQFVNKGKVLFTLKTKEAKSLGNTINKLDNSFNFTGVNVVKSPLNGYVTALNHQSGDYVQDGEMLVELADKSSFGFVMNLPYEYHQLLANNKKVKVSLPDGNILDGVVSQIMPGLDSVSQTQKVLVKVNSSHDIPNNLIATIAITKKESSHVSLPKQSVLTDESQTGFWVMKMINDSTAVKTPIKKGIESKGRIEILSPEFKPQDRILKSGNYGLADTALVRVR
ncbi:efflux RND transporter periplasmic adaptor subunit [Pedobacter sp. SD-b]|uniref:Efflux RND transporter periplasmic adaptor subunit n=1 Tax=Pedobacter segetis TaxID=2793069 RepID=A0ABS1BI66_9SPHI|nr:efflux RND transporter periplasmic adaptor subunit [Pedobacter segetis]MBK0382545.1 efflux RND transporter periplasmic adaptor subunit [Pedobacter segetis]